MPPVYRRFYFVPAYKRLEVGDQRLVSVRIVKITQLFVTINLQCAPLLVFLSGIIYIRALQLISSL